MIKPKRVAVLSRSFSRHPTLRAELMQLYPDVTFNDTGRTLEGEEIIAFLKGHDGAVVALEKITESLLKAVPELRIIGKYGVGLDNVDLHAASRLGVKIGWKGGVNRRSVSELAIGLMLSLLRLIPQTSKEVRDGIWRQTLGRQLSDRVVGVVGCGHVGKDLIQLLKPFGCRVLAHDIRDFSEFYAEHGVTSCDLDTLLKEADVVTLHLPLTSSTRNLLDERRLGLMRSDAILVNTARGGLVDEAVLKKMLIEGKLAGAGFDVFAKEPPTDTELINLPNFIAIPHIGGSAAEAVLAMGRAAIEGLANATDPLDHIPDWAR